MTRHEIDVPEGAQPGRHQDDAASANQFPAIAYKKGVTDAYATFSEFLWDFVPIIPTRCRRSRRGRHVHPARRAALQLLHRPEVAPLRAGRDGHGPGAALDEAIRVDNACLDGAPASRRDHVHPPLPRQQPQPVVRRGRLRPDRREAVRRSSTWTRSCSSTRPSASGTFEPLRFVPKGKTVVLGPGQQQAPGARVADDAASPHRRGGPVRATREACAQPAVRLRLDGRGQPAVNDEQWRKLELVATWRAGCGARRSRPVS